MMKLNSIVLAGAMMLAGVVQSASAASFTSTVSPTTGTGIVQFSELDLTPITCFDDDGKTLVRANLTTSGDPIVLKGVKYESGVGTHAPSLAVIDLKGSSHFYAILGVDDDADQAAEHGIVDYTVTLYKDKVASEVASGTLYRQGNDVKVIDIDVTGYDYLKLNYATGAQPWADHCVWADARFTCTGTNRPKVITEEEMYASTDDPTKVYLPEAGPNGEEIIALSSLDLTKITNGWSTVKANKSIDGRALTMKGITYMSGVGCHATAKVNVKLNGSVTAFHAVLGIDDEVKTQSENDNTQGVCDYSVYLVRQNGETTDVASGTIRYKDAAPVTVDVRENLSDYKYLIMEFPAGDQNGNDHVDIANAYFEYVEQNSTRPVLVSDDEMAGSLNCATTMFSQPGVRYMHKLHSNNSDAVITVSELPAGLEFNEERCLVEGMIETEGDYTYKVHVAVEGETTDYPVSLTVSSKLGLPTPFMGWISWNVVQGNISQSVVESVADAFVSQGLYDAGYKYLVIDDLWHASSRAADGSPLPDPAKFPNGMEAAAKYVHDKGLRFGIYSNGGTRTCAGMFGSYQYETIDANAYAKWGVDLLKYDYCSNPGEDVATCKSVYKAMGDALKASGRDIILYVCEWGVREPWKWGAEVGGSCWRATYDVRDCWLARNPGVGVVQSVEGMKDIWAYSGVNRFNDADMLCTAIHGTGKSSSDLCATGPGMTQDEYRSQFAMWCMWSSPLSLTFDLRNPIAEDDLAIMTNPEMIALDQDRMGQAAQYLGQDANECLLFSKDLENGDVAVAVINMSDADHSYSLDLASIPGLDPEKKYIVRDVQERADMPEVTDGTMDIATVRTHATVVYRFSEKNEETGLTSPTEALDRMTVSAADGVVTVCVPGTGSASKRVLLSDVEGRVVAATTTGSECVSLPARGCQGVYVVQVVCAGRAHSAKVAL